MFTKEETERHERYMNFYRLHGNLWKDFEWIFYNIPNTDNDEMTVQFELYFYIEDNIQVAFDDHYISSVLGRKITNTEYKEIEEFVRNKVAENL